MLNQVITKVGLAMLLSTLCWGCQAPADHRSEISVMRSPLADRIPEKTAPQGQGSVLSWASPDQFDLGIGYLAPAQPIAEEKPMNWIRDMAIPWFESPEGEFRGWLIDGWRIPLEAEQSPVPLEKNALLEVKPGQHGLVLLHHRRDGWIRFRFAKPRKDQREYGTGWTQVKYLNESSPPLAIYSWQKWMTDQTIQPLSYRKPWVKHAMRKAPSLEAEFLGWIRQSHDLYPLEVRGDWLKARIVQPSAFCATGKKNARTETAWIRWWHPENGLWLWRQPSPCP